MNETEFQNSLIKAAQLLGWKVAHFRGVRIQRKNGSIYYATPVQADGEGFVDLVMVRGNRLICAELKSDKGRTSKEQDDWLEKLGLVAETYVWKPKDWEEITRVLE